MGRFLNNPNRGSNFNSITFSTWLWRDKPRNTLSSNDRNMDFCEYFDANLDLAKFFKKKGIISEYCK